MRNVNYVKYHKFINMLLDTLSLPRLLPNCCRCSSCSVKRVDEGVYVNTRGRFIIKIQFQSLNTRVFIYFCIYTTTTATLYENNLFLAHISAFLSPVLLLRVAHKRRWHEELSSNRLMTTTTMSVASRMKRMRIRERETAK